MSILLMGEILGREAVGRVAENAPGGQSVHQKKKHLWGPPEVFQEIVIRLLVS